MRTSLRIEISQFLIFLTCLYPTVIHKYPVPTPNIIKNFHKQNLYAFGALKIKHGYMNYIKKENKGYRRAGEVMWYPTILNTLGSPFRLESILVYFIFELILYCSGQMLPMLFWSYFRSLSHWYLKHERSNPLNIIQWLSKILDFCPVLKSNVM